MKALLLLLTIIMIGPRSQAQSFQDLFQNAESYRPPHFPFTSGAFIEPNEDDFYLFDSYLRRQSDVLVSVGTFRSLEDASRGNFSHVLMLDIDLLVVQFNLFQIDLLKRSPTRRDFILNYWGDPQLFQKHPLLEEFVEKAEFHNFIFYVETHGIIGQMQGSGDFRSKKFPYLDEILKLCDVSRGWKAGFLSSEVRYQKLHQLASQGKMASVQADLSGESFLNIGQTLRQQGLRVSVLDVSNSPDYFLDSLAIRIDDYRLGLANIPWTAEAQVLFTTTLMEDVPRSGPWHYFHVPAQKYVFEIGAILNIGAYGLWFQWNSTREWRIHPQQLNLGELQCRELF